MLDVSRYLTDPERKQRRQSLGEREQLAAFLDFQRDTIIWKLDGLTREQLVAKHTPSGMSLLGLVKHMAYVERNWFQIRFLGLPLSVPWRSGDRNGDFRIEPDEKPESVIEFYLREIAESRRIFAATDSLDARAKEGSPKRSMRWIMVHMIEETARHCGHADFMREFTDGRTGE